jgi:DNA topoisomerase VI subunit B
MLIRPEIVERALRKKYAERLPKELAEEGSIANLVHQIILSWCTDELDDLAVKIQEYNRNWIRRTYEHETLKEGEKQVTAFIRESWQEPIARQEIPWKLVDGKTLLRRLRHKLQDYKIMVPDSAILDVMSVEDFDASIKTAIELVYSWF